MKHPAAPESFTATDLDPVKHVERQYGLALGSESADLALVNLDSAEMFTMPSQSLTLNHRKPGHPRSHGQDSPDPGLKQIAGPDSALEHKDTAHGQGTRETHALPAVQGSESILTKKAHWLDARVSFQSPRLNCHNVIAATAAVSARRSLGPRLTGTL